ncbi:AAA family ATPase [Hoylesella loescheii]|uniref:AAA family ATPase n=1 Tax=Hoylesella loescheii TaxID=840 RepID=UPI0028ED051B|nr:AAA family ATPase [Hoylesella loescheii]
MVSFIKTFKIQNLFGYKDVEMSFEDSYKIIVGENGTGKTTILNCLYYTLSKRFELLSNIRFDSITINFTKNRKIEFTKKEVDAYNEKEKEFQHSQFYRLLSSKIKEKNIKRFSEIVYSSADTIEKSSLVTEELQNIGFKFSSSYDYLYKNIVRLVHEYMSIEFSNKLDVLDTVFQSEIVYFPTYRRVESGFVGWNNMLNKVQEKYPFLDFDRKEVLDEFHSEMIQFGMEDVKDKIKSLTSQIYKKTMEGFTSIMASMLSQLSNNITQENKEYKFEDNKIGIILDRLGDRIKEDDKKSIKEYALSKKLNNSNLNYLIGKLIKLYENQKDIDLAIKKFIETCNHYLMDKQFVYNESSIDVYVEISKTKERLDLEYLSSGEKQIVSLFARLYLGINEKLIILLDEPELSLSIMWQERLLVDVKKSNKCDFLLAVTHSPFIYDNEMKDFAYSLSDYTKM